VKSRVPQPGDFDAVQVNDGVSFVERIWLFSYWLLAIGF
jgi:hypothetical protein